MLCFASASASAYPDCSILLISCMFPTSAVKKAALEHGVAYAPLGPDGDKFGLKDLETTVTAVFDVSDTMTVHACGRQRILAAPGETQIDAIPAASTITTGQTRVMPTVKWSCKPEKLYSMVMYDAFNGPVTNMSFGYTHWIKINIPCDSATTLATSTGGVTFGEINYFYPDNFEAAPHNYGFYILEQRGAAAITPTQAELERFDRAKIRNGVSLRRFIEWVSGPNPNPTPSPEPDPKPKPKPKPKPGLNLT